MSRGSPAVEARLAGEIVLESLDDLLLAIHEIDVVAKKQVQILCDPRAAGAIGSDRTGAADRSRTRRPAPAANPPDAGTPRSARAERKTATAACCAPLPGNRSASGCSRIIVESASSRLELPLRMALEHRTEQSQQHAPAFIQRAKFDCRPLPTISSDGATLATSQREYLSGILITRREVNAAFSIKLLQNVAQST